MKLQDWLAIASIGIALVAGGFAAWVQNEARLSAMERQIKSMLKTEMVVREIVIDTMKDVHQLKGQHQGHGASHEHEQALPMSVKARAWLTDSEM